MNQTLLNQTHPNTMNIPNNQQETLAQQVRWAARNLAYNLNFLPADKFDWKPTPTAPSALEIVNHIMGGLENARDVLRGGQWNEASDAGLAPVTSVGDAKTQLVGIADKFAATLEALRPDQLERVIETPYGVLPLAQVIRFEPTDIVHHHGQIAYIQQLLGDTESHFDPEAF